MSVMIGTARWDLPDATPSPEDLALGARYNAILEGYAHLTPRGRAVWLNYGHGIHEEAPDVVAQEIVRVAAEAAT